MKYEPQEKDTNSCEENQKKIIKFYKERFRKVNKAWLGNCKCERYISFADKELE